MKDKDHSGTDFSRQDLSDQTFENCVLRGCNFRSANLSGATFTRCQFNDDNSEDPADFSHAHLRECTFTHCNLTVVDMTHCSAYDVVFEHCQMQGADLSKSDFRLPVGQTGLAALTMTDCNFSYGNLANTFLPECTLSGNRMIEACMDYCDLSGADLSDTELHNISAVGMVLVGADLRGATFNNINPREIDLSGVKINPEQAAYLLNALGLVLD